MKTLQHFLIFTGIASLLACSHQENSTSTGDGTEATARESAMVGGTLSMDQINGKWLVMAATRDYTPTNTLKDAYFIFGPGNALKVNLDGQERAGTVRISGDSLFQEVQDMPVAYTAKMEDNKIYLEGMIQSMIFQFELGRDTSATAPPK